MWVPVLYTHQSQLPAHVQVRLQTCLNHQPSSETQGDLRFMYGMYLMLLEFSLNNFNEKNSFSYSIEMAQSFTI